VGNTDEHFQQQLPRSYSLELPMELKGNQSMLTSVNTVPPRIRYSTMQQQQQLMNTDKPNRSSLNNGDMSNSQVSLQNRKVYIFLNQLKIALD
jgi:hypothetical protein